MPRVEYPRGTSGKRFRSQMPRGLTPPVGLPLQFIANGTARTLAATLYVQTGEEVYYSLSVAQVQGTNAVGQSIYVMIEDSAGTSSTPGKVYAAGAFPNNENGSFIAPLSETLQMWYRNSDINGHWMAGTMWVTE